MSARLKKDPIKPKRGRPAGGDAKKTRARIISAAAQCFNSREYSDTSMEQIAKVAGLTGPAIYVHFKSKEDLFIQTALTFMQRAYQILSKAADHGGSWDQRLSKVINAQRSLQAEVKTFPLIYSVVQARMVRFPERYGSVIEMRAKYSQVFTSIAQQAIDEGGLPTATDAQIAGELLMAMTSNAIGTVRLYHSEEGDIDRIVHAAKALLSIET